MARIQMHDSVTTRARAGARLRIRIRRYGYVSYAELRTRLSQ